MVGDGESETLSQHTPLTSSVDLRLNNTDAVLSEFCGVFNLNTDLIPPPSDNNNNPVNDSQPHISFEDNGGTESLFSTKSLPLNNIDTILSEVYRVFSLNADLIPPPSDNNNNRVNISQPPIFFDDNPIQCL